ncbi:MAG: S8 family serine peptidase, partial [Bacillota bacterium]
MVSLVLAYIAAVASLARRAAKTGYHRHRRKIVIFGPDVDAGQHGSIVKSCGGRVKRALPLINAAVCVFPDEEQAMALLTRRREVKWIEDDSVFEIVRTAAPGAGTCKRCFGLKGPGFSTQTTPWGVTRIDAPSVWKKATGRGIRVGVVDTGVNAGHPDLAGNIKGTFNPISGAVDAEDDNGHGTHVAGTIAALDNEFGVVGVAPEAEIYAVKSFDSKGKGMASDIIQGIAWCIGQNVKIINMSFGSADPGKA